MKKNKGVHITKKHSHVYANINWDNVTSMFRKQQTLSDKPGRKKFPPVADLLRLVAAGGTVGLLLAFPGVGVAVAPFVLGNQSFQKWRVKKVLVQLEKQKYVSLQNQKNGMVTVKITKNGMQRALTYSLDSMSLTKMKRWDRKWRVVIFDIPEKYRRLRDIFRTRLRQLGLYPMQESVFIAPYSCFDEIEFLRELYAVSFSVKYLVAEKIEDDEFFLRHFELNA